MTRTASRSVPAFALMATLIHLAAGVSGQSGQRSAPPSAQNGEWPHYTADLKGTRYSPLDQINASNFNQLEVAWRFKTDNLGTRPEFKLEGTPLMVKGMLYATAGTRRSVVALRADTGELVWVHAEFEGKRAIHSPRQLSGRGLSYWTDGKEERIIYVTTGYRMIALDAKTGNRIPIFGADGVVDLKVGIVQGKGEQIDRETGDIGLHSTPIVVKDVVIVGSAMKEGFHTALKGMNIPKTGQPGSVGLVVTKTLVILGDPQVTTTPDHPRGAMLRAYDKTTGKEVGAVWMPAPQSGSPMTYSVNGRQYIVVAVSGGPYSGEYIAFSLPRAATTTNSSGR